MSVELKLITAQPISAAQLSSTRNYPACGALVTFDGIVRNHHEGKSVLRLEYEAYVPMAGKVMASIASEIENEWPGAHALAVHRMGPLAIGDVAVAIAVWTPHRTEAFAACKAFIDRIKKRVPVWKKEFYADETFAWVRCHHE